MNNKTFEAQGIWLNMRLTLGLTFFSVFIHFRSLKVSLQAAYTTDSPSSLDCFQDADKERKWKLKPGAAFHNRAEMEVGSLSAEQ